MRHKVIGASATTCRFILAVVFIFSGFVKAIDPLGTQYKIQDYLDAFGWGNVFPDFFSLMTSIAIGWIEFCLGVYLFFGIRRRIAPRAVVIIMSVMTPLTFWLAIDNPISDCGCFGDAIVLSNWGTFWKNVFLLGMAIFLLKHRKQIFPLVTVRLDWLIALYSSLYIFCMIVYCLHHLPVFDFRPYHIGANIGEDITEQVLSDDNYTFLLISHQMNWADEDYMDVINDVYDYCFVYGYPFYCLTSSSDEDIQKWMENTGAEYSFCMMDNITLKTMIRSNPGLMLLKKGVVVNKWGNGNLPNEDVLQGPLEELSIGKVNRRSFVLQTVIMILWFVLPLCLICYMDLYWERRRKREETMEKI